MTTDDLTTEIDLVPASRPAEPPRKPRRPRALPPTQVADIEDVRAYRHLLGRLFLDIQPKTGQQEADLLALGQLRWTVQRLSSLIERDLNQNIRVAHARQFGDSELRVLAAYKSCLRDKEFVLLFKHHLAALKTMNSISTRIDRWNVKAPRRNRSIEIETD